LNTTNARSENLVEGGGMWGSIKGKKRCAVVCQGYASSDLAVFKEPYRKQVLRMVDERETETSAFHEAQRWKGHADGGLVGLCRS
jgi:putative SOS response-associated peptidase YedK